MDVLLRLLDHSVLTPYIYPTWWSEDNPVRQYVSILTILVVGAGAMIAIADIFHFYSSFDQRVLQHPQVLKNQIRREITTALTSVPIMAAMTAVVFLIQVRGYSKLYDNFDWSASSFAAILMSLITIVIFSDTLNYWVHRGLHHKYIYKHVHKEHHTWKVPTPFAGHAFNPLDGFVQSLAYHACPFLFPVNKIAFLGFFLFVNVWTVSIHDGQCRLPKALQTIVSAGAHHADHHSLYDCNYGQFFTFWDRVGGTHHYPAMHTGDGALDQVVRRAAGKPDMDTAGERTPIMHANGKNGTVGAKEIKGGKAF